MSSRCRVGLFAQPLFSPRTGIGRYVYDLSAALHARQDTSLSLISDFGKRFGWPDYLRDAEQNQTKSRNPSVIQRARAFAATIPPLSVGHLRLQASALAKRIDPSELDVFHGPNFFAPPMRVPRVVTIHDLTTIDGPEWHPRARVERTNLAIRLSLDADAILTISEFTKRRLIDVFRIPEERIFVTHLYPSNGFFIGRRNELNEKSFLYKNNLNARSFCLCVSTVEPRKNLDRLVKAYAALPLELRRTHPLVLVGGYGWKAQSTLRLIENAAREGWLKYLQRVTDEEVIALTRHANFAAFPSLYEGFGLPIVEALACGLRVVVANTEVSREIAGDCGIYFEPSSTVELTAALTQAYEMATSQHAEEPKSIERAALFSENTCVEKTLGTYHLAATHSRR
jgi:glycosyltransferase involved in cell wall biosynthesis